MQVKEKKVEMIELFYDLIYVYAISKMTKLIETPKNGVIPLFEFFHYFVVCFVILQAWLYLTNYINRYGSWKWYEYGFTMINMVATIYMANTIQENWEVMAQPFNLSMLAMLLCVVAMYLIQIIKKEQDLGAAKNILVNLSIICSLYCLAFIASFFQFSKIIFWMDTIAVLTGAFLPSIIRGNFDIQIISFPHLAERFELITIITFGEGVVDMTGYFDVSSFTLCPILVFCLILTLFGCYTIQLHDLANRHRVDRSLRLIYTHYFIVIAINLITGAIELLENPVSNRLFIGLLMIGAMSLFFLSLYFDSAYYKKGFVFTKSDGAIGSLSLGIGALIMLLGRENVSILLFGALIGALGNFLMLLGKEKGCLKKRRA